MVTELLLALSTVSLGTQPRRTDTLTVEQIKSFYADVFALERNQQGQASFALGNGELVLGDDHPLAGLVSGNEFFFLYLVQNWSGVVVREHTRLTPGGDFGDYYEALANDPQFTDVFLPTVARYLEREGGGLVGYEGDLAIREVSLRRALDTSTRFFYPDGVDDTGSLTAHVCVGINGLLDLQGGRDPYVEALAYLAINKEMENSRHGVLEAFLKAYNQVNSLNLSTDADTRVTRAQGVMWATMHQSEELRTALLMEHERVKAWLPIRIRSPEGP